MVLDVDDDTALSQWTRGGSDRAAATPSRTADANLWGDPDLWLGVADPDDDDGDDMPDTDVWVDHGDPVASAEERA